jgi:hypothetical protein
LEYSEGNNIQLSNELGRMNQISIEKNKEAD